MISPMCRGCMCSGEVDLRYFNSGSSSFLQIEDRQLSLVEGGPVLL